MSARTTSAGASNVSVVIPARDAALTIGRTIRSIVRQTAGAPHLILVDDGSTDDTVDRAHATAHGAAIEVVPTGGIGPGGARNAGLGVATTEFVAFSDADDEWTPDRLRRHLERFATQPATGIVIGVTRFESEHADLLDGYRFDTDDRSALIPSFGATTIRRDVFDLVGPIDEALPSHEDYDWLLRARDLGVQFDVDARPAQTQHLRPDSVSHSGADSNPVLMQVLHRSVKRRRSAGLPPAEQFPSGIDRPVDPASLGPSRRSDE